MQEPPWMPRTYEEYLEQLAEDEAEEIGEALERQRQALEAAREPANRLLAEVANHRFVMQHAHDPDMRFADDIEIVARAVLTAAERSPAQRAAAALEG